jgi:ABC-2 type transport system ATP-binding protein
VAERIADRIGIIQSGKLLAEGTLAELREKAGERDATLEDVFLELTGELGGDPGAETAEALAGELAAETEAAGA